MFLRDLWKANRVYENSFLNYRHEKAVHPDREVKKYGFCTEVVDFRDVRPGLHEMMTEKAHEGSVFTLVSAWVILSVNILF